MKTITNYQSKEGDVYQYNSNTGALRNANGELVGQGIEAIEVRELMEIKTN